MNITTLEKVEIIKVVIATTTVGEHITSMEFYPDLGIYTVIRDEGGGVELLKKSVDSVATWESYKNLVTKDISEYSEAAIKKTKKSGSFS